MEFGRPQPPIYNRSNNINHINNIIPLKKIIITIKNSKINYPPQQYKNHYRWINTHVYDANVLL
jgi:hypothetical protein